MQAGAQPYPAQCVPNPRVFPYVHDSLGVVVVPRATLEVGDVWQQFGCVDDLQRGRE